MLETEEKPISHCLEDLLWKKLWTCRKTDSDNGDNYY